MNIIFAAMGLKRSAYYATTKDGTEGLELALNSTEQKNVEAIFANYNGNPGPSGF